MESFSIFLNAKLNCKIQIAFNPCWVKNTSHLVYKSICTFDFSAIFIWFKRLDIFGSSLLFFFFLACCLTRSLANLWGLFCFANECLICLVNPHSGWLFVFRNPINWLIALVLAKLVGTSSCGPAHDRHILEVFNATNWQSVNTKSRKSDEGFERAPELSSRSLPGKHL